MKTPRKSSETPRCWDVLRLKDPPHIAATFSYLHGHLDATRASKSSNDSGKIQLLALQNESIVGGWTFHGRSWKKMFISYSIEREAV